MTTTTSFSNQGQFVGLYKSTLRRNFGYFGLISALLLVFYPLQYAMEVFGHHDWRGELQMLIGDYSLLGLGRNFTPTSAFFYTAILLIVPLVLALHLNSYMHSKKASDVYHAVPVSRGTLLTVNMAAAMTILAVPVVVSNLLVAVFQVCKFGFFPALLGYQLLDMVGWLICAFAIYAVATFACVLVGTVFDSFVYTMIMLGIVPLLGLLCFMMEMLFLCGFVPNERAMLNLLNLSPMLLMPTRFALHSIHDGYGNLLPKDSDPIFFQFQMFSDSNLAMVCWLFLSAALFVLTVRLYRRRSSEKAEITTTQGALPTFVKLAVTLCAGLVIGTIFSQATVFIQSENASFLIWAAIGGILTYVILEAVFNRGFKTVLRSLPLGVGMTVFTLAFSAIFMTGGLGYEKRVPNISDIESVEINYTGTYGGGMPQKFGEEQILPDGTSNWKILAFYQTVELREPQNIQAVQALHQAVAGRKYDDYWHSLSLTYRLKNGKTLSRSYSGIPSEEIERLLPIEISGEFLAQTNPAYFVKGQQVTSWELQDPFGFRHEEIGEDWTAEESQELLDAIAADAASMTLEDLKNPQSEPVAILNCFANPPKEGSERFCRWGIFPVTDRTTHTYAFLAKKNLLEGLEVDWDDCYAVTAEVFDRGRSNHIFVNDSIVLSSLSGHMSRVEDLEYVTERINELRFADNLGEREDGVYGEYLFLSEDASDIRTLSEHASFYCREEEPVAIVSFYFKGRENGKKVLVPLANLPASLQERMTAYCANSYGYSYSDYETVTSTGMEGAVVIAG